ncbi:MAG: hypothetical protein U0T36_05185 [Saprospiraceae bacterium]
MKKRDSLRKIIEAEAMAFHVAKADANTRCGQVQYTLGFSESHALSLGSLQH